MKINSKNKPRTQIPDLSYFIFSFVEKEGKTSLIKEEEYKAGNTNCLFSTFFCDYRNVETFEH